MSWRPMRWGLVPRWWNKPLKELRMTTFNARAETVEHQAGLPRCVQAHALLDPGLRILRVAEYGKRESSRGILPPEMARRY